MTIAIAVRTMSSVVFATDSKLTAKGISGIRPDGAPNWVEQTYDNATKVVHDRSRGLMALAAGTVNIGQVSALDFIAAQWIIFGDNRTDEEAAIVGLLDVMADEKRRYYERTTSTLKPEDWPGPSLLLAIHPRNRGTVVP